MVVNDFITAERPRPGSGSRSRTPPQWPASSSTGSGHGAPRARPSEGAQPAWGGTQALCGSRPPRQPAARQAGATGQDESCHADRLHFPLHSVSASGAPAGAPAPFPSPWLPPPVSPSAGTLRSWHGHLSAPALALLFHHAKWPDLNICADPNTTPSESLGRESLGRLWGTFHVFPGQPRLQHCSPWDHPVSKNIKGKEDSQLGGHTARGRERQEEAADGPEASGSREAVLRSPG